MIKRFCDGCGKEITAANVCEGGHASGARLGTVIQKRNALKIEVMTATNGTWNAGDWCKHCVLDALYKLDDRRTNKAS